MGELPPANFPKESAADRKLAEADRVLREARERADSVVEDAKVRAREAVAAEVEAIKAKLGR